MAIDCLWVMHLHHEDSHEGSATEITTEQFDKVNIMRLPGFVIDNVNGVNYHY